MIEGLLNVRPSDCRVHPPIHHMREASRGWIPNAIDGFIHPASKSGQETSCLCNRRFEIWILYVARHELRLADRVTFPVQLGEAGSLEESGCEVYPGTSRQAGEVTLECARCVAEMREKR